MIISYFLKTVKLVIIILNMSFFFGVFWLVFVDLDPQLRLDFSGEKRDIFSEYFEINDIHEFMGTEAAHYRKILIVTYYAFTSLCTVGFGDYHPRSNRERLVCTFILLFGVAIFSYIMGIFCEILEQFKLS